MTEPKNYADAVVLCRDGKYRTFVATTAHEVLNYEGRKYTYLLVPEPEGRGFVTMKARECILAPEGMQPVKIEARTWAWSLELGD